MRQLAPSRGDGTISSEFQLVKFPSKGIVHGKILLYVSVRNAGTIRPNKKAARKRLISLQESRA